MHIKNFVEKIHLLWVPVIGVAFIIYGIYLFLDICTIETAGQPVRMKKILQVIYNLGGKQTILVIFELTGVILLVSGIQQLRRK
ncbi:hypothetical protein D3C87_95020 [compost metagenome]